MRFKRLKKILHDDIEFVDFIKKFYNELIDELNTGLLNRLTIEDNLAVDIREVEIAAGGTVGVSHRLKVTPKYRIILKQTGNGVITDAAGWDDRRIFLTNNGAVTVKITIALMRG